MTLPESKTHVPNDKEAFGGFGTHFAESLSFEEFAPAAKQLFELIDNFPQEEISILDAAGGNGKRFPNGLIYLASKPGRKINYTITDLVNDSLQEFQEGVCPRLPSNIVTRAQQADLSEPWQIADQTFDAAIMSFALHWFGENHELAITEMVRTIKTGGIGYISTLTPFDLAAVNQTFPLSFSEEELRLIYPEAQISRGTSRGKPVWNVRRDNQVALGLTSNPDYATLDKHPMIGRATQITGFQPGYLTKILASNGCEVILEDQAENTSYPNGYSEGERQKSHLHYIFKKR
jgi:ubiquinone/menaquinone biosynthesis C-methylase UbiE